MGPRSKEGWCWGSWNPAGGAGVRWNAHKASSNLRAARKLIRTYRPTTSAKGVSYGGIGYDHTINFSRPCYGNGVSEEEDLTVLPVDNLPSSLHRIVMHQGSKEDGMWKGSETP